MGQVEHHLSPSLSPKLCLAERGSSEMRMERPGLLYAGGLRMGFLSVDHRKTWAGVTVVPNEHTGLSPTRERE